MENQGVNLETIIVESKRRNSKYTLFGGYDKGDLRSLQRQTKYNLQAAM